MHLNKAAGQLSLSDFIIPTVLTSLVLGVIIGALRVYMLNNLEYTRLCANIDYIIQSGGNIVKNNSEIFVESIVKYGKIPIIIWFLAFLPPGALIALILLIVKGMSLGFTTAILTRHYGGQGVFYAIILYLPQNLSLIPAYIYVSVKSLRFAIDISYKQRVNSDERKTIYRGFFGQLFDGNMQANTIAEYALALLLSCTCVVLATLLEIYGVPLLITVFGL